MYEQEVSFWVDIHHSQGYCNVTLIREDSRKFVMGVMEKARGGLGQSEAIAMNAMQNAGSVIGNQLQRAQSAGADGLMLAEKEVIPKAGKLVAEVRDKAASLYDTHLADIVNKNVAPVYNQHVHPFYKENVSPIVMLMKNEAGIVIGKSLKEIQKARTKATSLIEASSTSAMKVIKEKRLDEKVPVWLMTILKESSKDGKIMFDRLWSASLILFVLISRSLIKRIIGAFFSIIWFFCPLRLFVTRGKVVDNGGREYAKSSK